MRSGSWKRWVVLSFAIWVFSGALSQALWLHAEAHHAAPHHHGHHHDGLAALHPDRAAHEHDVPDGTSLLAVPGIRSDSAPTASAVLPALPEFAHETGRQLLAVEPPARGRLPSPHRITVLQI